MFLVGAYQEVLGDLHNLFGDTNAIHVTLAENGQYNLERVVQGDLVEDVLGYMQYSRKDLIGRVREAAEAALRRGAVEMRETKLPLQRFREGLSGYTYLSSDAEETERRDASPNRPQGGGRAAEAAAD